MLCKAFCASLYVCNYDDDLKFCKKKINVCCQIPFKLVPGMVEDCPMLLPGITMWNVPVVGNREWIWLFTADIVLTSKSHWWLLSHGSCHGNFRCYLASGYWHNYSHHQRCRKSCLGSERFKGISKKVSSTAKINNCQVPWFAQSPPWPSRDRVPMQQRQEDQRGAGFLWI